MSFFEAARDNGNSGKNRRRCPISLADRLVVALVVPPAFVSDPVLPVVGNGHLLSGILLIGVPVHP
jgi:hypothetical protein